MPTSAATSAAASEEPSLRSTDSEEPRVVRDPEFSGRESDEARKSDDGRDSNATAQEEADSDQGDSDAADRSADENDDDDGEGLTTADNAMVAGGVMGETAFLHGRIEVLIEKGRRLLNKDGLATCLPAGCAAACCRCGLLGLSDPMVKLMLGKHVLARTSSKSNSLNPNWNELFSVDTCHETKRLTLRVVDVDAFGEQYLGQVSFSAAQLLRQGRGSVAVQGEFPLSRRKSEVTDLNATDDLWAEDKRAKRQRRKGKQGRFGWLSFRLRYTPAARLISKMEQAFLAKARSPKVKPDRLVEMYHPYTIPRTYFRAHRGDHFVMYQSAHQPGVGALLPSIELQEDGAQFTPRSCWSDMYAAISAAERFVCVAGWSVNPYTRLVRTGEGHESKLTFGGLLKKKANEGLIVLVMIWDDLSSNSFNKTGVMGTMDEHCYEYFKGSKVVCTKVRREDPAGVITSMLNGTYAYTHHQKTVIMDVRPADASRLQVRHRRHKTANKVQAVTAFLGGIDITSGRYDDSDKTLFASLGRAHRDDFYQSCLPSGKVSKETGPRQPWQDIHVRVTGASAVDVLKNFVERWHRQVGDHRFPLKRLLRDRGAWARHGNQMRKLLDLLKHSPAEAARPQSLLGEARERLTGRTEVLLTLGHTDKNARNNFGRNRQNSQPYDEDDDEDDGKDDDDEGGDSDLSGEELAQLQRDLAELEEETRNRAGSWNDALAAGGGGGNSDRVVQVLRSIDEESARLERRIVSPFVHFDKDTKIDNSIHKAYVHLIRGARHFIYVESQYFIGSSHLWRTARGAGAANLVPGELAAKVCEKIAQGRPFHVYLVLPLFCEGVPSDTAVMQILRYQYLSIEMVYSRIADALRRHKVTDRVVTDYFSVFFLGNRESEEEGKVEAQREAQRRAERAGSTDSGGGGGGAAAAAAAEAQTPQERETEAPPGAAPTFNSSGGTDGATAQAGAGGASGGAGTAEPADVDVELPSAGGQRGTSSRDNQKDDTGQPDPAVAFASGDAAALVLQRRRFQIYVHSKLLIVDDAAAIIGSANINQRSFDGARDTEIGVLLYEASQIATDESTPRGLIYGLRMSLWAEHLGPDFVDSDEVDPTVLQRPASKECVDLVQARSVESWEVYADEEGPPRNVPGHLMRYPYHIDPKTGRVSAREGYEHFPDFPDSRVLGQKTNLPDFLTT